MKNIILVFCLQVITFSAYAQNSFDDLVEPRIQVLQNNTQIDYNAPYVILENDTLFANNYNAINLRFLLSQHYDNKLMLRYYERIVFCYLTPNPPIVYNLMQWNEPIVIFMDKDFPKDVREKFETFISNLQLREINHLDISFTKKLKNANYHIKSSDIPINGYKPDFKFDTEEDRLNDILTGSVYTLATDGNNKFYAGVLKIHLKSFKTNVDITKRLKQLFFKSLGNFVADNYKETTSLLHHNYDNSEAISEFDMNILKIHYAIIYEQKVNGATFKKLVQLAEKLD
ncbi:MULTISPECIES: hypothetical protein [Bizionia]|uniref:DUF2927 domain-containing protein n=1 Tax=Bizionia algoritergicola TaxID=291187 RepID=A0A5D0QW72_9FLAO|nr:MULTISPECIES: hypothetical protein [Bizionia]OBX19689.1 hypothetical protein BAA08_14980 [Bizionia sp. APA-3]TYB73473.1 hypothetical protein ES675_07405 [Bizionia algoritergicola]